MKKTLHIVIIYIVCYLFSSCEKNTNEIQTLFGDKIKILGHGGMGISSQYPFNAYESLEKALSIGANGVELDLQITKDSVLVAFHDRKLELQTNFSGYLIDYHWSELSSLQYQRYPYLNYSVISLQNFLKNGTYANKILYFDCKSFNAGIEKGSYEKCMARSLVKMISKYDIESNCYIESGSEFFLSEVRKELPRAKLIYLANNFEEALEIVVEKDYFGMILNTSKVTKEQVEITHQCQKAVAVWGVNSKKANKEAVEKNPDIIITDKLKHLVEYLN